jgi:CheY-like chemotaxis protein
MTNPFDGRTVLVVEDDGLVREDVADWLRQQGWIVLENAIGAGALQLIREAGRLRILFTDINLADAITGWDVADAGRASNPGLAVIYASGGPKDQARLLPQSVFCPSLRRRKISCARGLCLSPIKNGLT